MQELEECRLKVSHILQSSLMSDGSRRFATPPQQIAAYNKRLQPVQEETAEPSPPWVHSDKEFIVGDEVRALLVYVWNCRLPEDCSLGLFRCVIVSYSLDCLCFFYLVFRHQNYQMLLAW